MFSATKKRKKKGFHKMWYPLFQIYRLLLHHQIGSTSGWIFRKKKKKVTDLSFFLITYKRHKLYGEALENTKKKVNE